MRIPRIFHDAPLRPGSSVDLDERATRHVRSVLRRSPGQELELFDGHGGACRGTITTAGRGLRVELTRVCDGDRESPLAVHLALGISKGERMDLAIQKAVELGVASIQPLTTQRTVVRLDAVRAGRRIDHWRGIVRSASEQCGRNLLARVHPIARLDEWLGLDTAPSLDLMPTPGASAGLSDLPPPQAQPVRLLIGPEGGLSEAERGAAEAAGFLPLRLGPRVLRTETAAMAAIAAVMTAWGDMA
jgi:16S rRNA (uracil1498-N3)-methyltransferase